MGIYMVRKTLNISKTRKNYVTKTKNIRTVHKKENRDQSFNDISFRKKVNPSALKNVLLFDVKTTEAKEEDIKIKTFGKMESLRINSTQVSVE